ncbi:MAG TPA: SLC13 family permease [Candidatus Dormibacteraeota bacterium]|nr:SLC13 family permease [Candidatus Dormibacteraeota bacterium]
MTLATQLHWIPLAIFLLTYGLIAIESNLGWHLDRTATAFCGAVAMVLAGSVRPADAAQAIDWGTIVFLLGMMILVAHFQVSGFFGWVAASVARVARTRFQLLALIVFTSGILSAFFVNDTICLIFAPLVLSVTEELDLPLAPYAIALAMAANIGSAMSVTGNPQNALVGVSAHFTFLYFLGHLAPVSLVGLGLELAILALVYRHQIFGPLPKAPAPAAGPIDRTLLAKCGVAAALVVVLWAMGYSFPLVAISAAAVMMVLGRVPSRKIHPGVDWELLLFFASLFVVIRGLAASGVVGRMVEVFEPWLGGGAVGQLFGVSGAMLVLSNVVSNVPAVLLFRPLVPAFPHTRFVWLTLACTATLAGNATPFGSVASLIVLQHTKSRGGVAFGEFVRVGLLVTLVTTAAAMAILAAEYSLLPHP